MRELHVAARVEQLDAVLAFIEAALVGCPPKTAMQIAVAAEEVFVNIASHAYPSSGGDAVIRIAVGAYAEIEFEDSGIPYNPLEQADPDIQAPAEARAIGGLGIFMVKRIMDHLAYRRADGKNILRMKKRVAGHTPPL